MARRPAAVAWGALLCGAALYGRGLSDWAGRWGLPSSAPAAALAAACLAALAVLAAAYLLWLPLSWRLRVRRRGVARALAFSYGTALLAGGALGRSHPPEQCLAWALVLGTALAAYVLGTAVGSDLVPAFLCAALLLAAGFAAPAALFSRLGPAWGLAAALPAAFLAAALLALLSGPPRRFPERLGPALLPALLTTAAGTAWDGFLRPVGLYRAGGLSPRAVVGVDGGGGCFVQNRTGDLFHARADGTYRRLPLPAGLRLGRVAAAGEGALALEISPAGDRFWRLGGTRAEAFKIGGPTRETVFVTDFAMDGAVPVAVDALGARLVWVGPGGELKRSEYPPAEAGAPRLVAVEGGAVHVFTESGALLRLNPRGVWSVLRVPPPPGRAMALAVRDGRYFVVARGETRAAAVYQLSQGVAGRWRAARAEGHWPRLATDGLRSFSLEGAALSVSTLGGGARSAKALGPSPALTRAFDRTPAGALIRLAE